VLGADAAQVAVLQVDWEKARAFRGAAGGTAILREVSPEVSLAGDGGSSEQRSTIRQRLEQADPTTWHELLTKYIQAEIAAVIGSDPSALPDASRGFFDMGMDSLMTVELKNRLERALGRSLPATVAFDYPSINDLVGYLFAEVVGVDTAGQRVGSGLQDGSQDPGALVAQIKSLSEDKLEQMLEDELDRLAGS